MTPVRYLNGQEQDMRDGREAGMLSTELYTWCTVAGQLRVKVISRSTL